MVLVYTLDNDNRPVTYDKYGEKTAALVNTGICSLTFSDGDINVDPGESVVNCQLFVPSGINNVECSFYIGSKPFFSFFDRGCHLYGSDKNTLNYSIIVPDSGNKFRYYLGINTTGASLYSNKFTSVQKGFNSISLDNPTVLISPPPGADKINYTTEFSFFSDNTNGLYRTIFSGDSTNPYCVNVLSKSPNANVPDLKFLGIFPDVQKNYTWRVIKYSSLNNIDDFVLCNFAFNQKLLSITAGETRSFKFTSDPK
jgi:hypothetical protein